MVATTSNNSDAVRPPDLYFAFGGEKFEFQTSAKTGDGVFRFRWTLDPKKKGPPEHIHETEAETFTVVSGTLRIWIDGTPQDLGPGQTVTVEPRVTHRFLNPGTEPVVVDVSLDGTRQEDMLVPLAFQLAGRKKFTFREFTTLIVHDVEVRGSAPATRVGAAVMRGLAAMLRLFGAKPLPRAGAW